MKDQTRSHGLGLGIGTRQRVPVKEERRVPNNGKRAFKKLLPKSETLNQSLVAVEVFPPQVIEQAASIADHAKQAAA